jgi:hypothetical protein
VSPSSGTATLSANGSSTTEAIRHPCIGGR